MSKVKPKQVGTEENLFQLLCDHLSLGVALLDRRGRVVYLNPALKMLFDSEIHHWTDLKAFMIAMCEKSSPGDAELGETVKRIGSVMKEGQPSDIHEETVIMHKRGGGKSPITIRLTLLNNRHSLILFQGDIVDRNINCVLGEDCKTGDIPRTLRKLAHDSSNVLGAVSGYAELALDDLPDLAVSLRHFLQQILKGSARARDLVRQIEALPLQ